MTAARIAERDQPVAATNAQTIATPATLHTRKKRCCICNRRKNNNDTKETWYPLTANKWAIAKRRIAVCTSRSTDFLSPANMPRIRPDLS